MPWIRCVGVTLATGALLAGCAFHGDYAGGHYRCSDGVCPRGLACVASECIAPGDAGAGSDALGDARLPARTCADPGLLPAGGDTVMGTTAPPHANTVTAMCAGSVLNGYDATYRVTTAAGDHVRVSITGSFPAAAYVIAPCQTAPNVPACEGNVLATAGMPIDVTPASAGAQFVVVDAVNPNDRGAYTLAVSVGP